RRYLKALRASESPAVPLPVPSLHVSADARARVLSTYPTWASGPSIVILAISGAEGKQWPLERFAAVADELAVSGARVLFLASPDEHESMTRLHGLCKRPHDFETGFRLPEVVAAIAHA